MSPLSFAAQIGLGLTTGLAAGSAYFITLGWTVRLIGAGAYIKALLAQCLRFGLLAAIFFALAGCGAAALLSGAVGLLFARQLVLHRVRRLQ